MESFNDLSEPDKLAWLQLFERQAKSAKEFCQQNELVYHQFLSWKRSMEPPEESKPQFVEVNCELPEVASPSGGLLAELDLSSGITLRIYHPQPLS